MLIEINMLMHLPSEVPRSLIAFGDILASYKPLQLYHLTNLYSHLYIFPSLGS